ncbi:leucine-rich repeat domain-containing protein [Paludibacter sp.]
MFTISSSAVAFVVNEISYTLLSSTKKTVEVVSGSMKYFGNVNIPSTIVYNNVTYTVVSVGPSAFADCVDLTSVNLPETVNEIKQSAFKNCGKLSTIEFPSALKIIGDYAFQGTGIIQINLPANVITIGTGAFWKCANLTYVNLPDGLEVIMDSAFEGCTSLKSISFPDSFEYFKSSILRDCTSLTSVKLPQSLKTFGVGFFMGCTSLESVQLPATMTQIAASAFSGCTKLKEITIPASVTSIGPSAFYLCSGLTSIYSLPEVPIASIGVNAFSNVNLSSCILYVPIGTKNLYKTANQWKDFVNIVEMSTGFIHVDRDKLNVSYNNILNQIDVCWRNEEALLSLFDSSGKTFYSQIINDKTIISTNKFVKGVYVISIKPLKGKVYTSKVIIY